MIVIMDVYIEDMMVRSVSIINIAKNVKRVVNPIEEIVISLITF